MSIFDRLISTLTGGDNAPAQPPAKAPASEGEEKRQRFMARDDAHAEPEKPVEKGLIGGPSLIWLHVQPTTQRLVLVPELGVAEGEELNGQMTADLHRVGWCEEVAYHAGYDQYWKMPTQEAILRMPTLHSVEVLPMKQMKLTTQLVKPGEARGFWMRVRLREESELPQPDSAQDSRVG